MENKTLAIELRGITKTFGSVVANENVDLSLRKGEILALLGENGSGKTTLMNMLSGIYQPDSGQILVGGKEVSISSPEDAKNSASAWCTNTLSWLKISPPPIISGSVTATRKTASVFQTVCEDCKNQQGLRF